MMQRFHLLALAALALAQVAMVVLALASSVQRVLALAALALAQVAMVVLAAALTPRLGPRLQLGPQQLLRQQTRRWANAAARPAPPRLVAPLQADQHRRPLSPPPALVTVPAQNQRRSAKLALAMALEPRQ